MLPSDLIRKLKAALGSRNVLTGGSERLVYESDAYTLERGLPQAVLLPKSTEEVQAAVRLLHSYGIPFVARGAGTGLSGGATPVNDSVVISLARMNRIVGVDFRNRLALVEAGTVNLRLTQVASMQGFHFAPDPSSRSACTIGGNIAENAGGPHTLKYGVTTNHVEGLELVLADGKALWVWADAPTAEGGYDLAGLLCGSEGSLGIVTRALVRLVPTAPSLRTLLAHFRTVDDATRCVSAIVAQGIIPSALEMVDHVALKAVEGAFHLGLAPDVRAILLIELDQLDQGIDEDMQRIIEVCLAHGCRKTELAADAATREKLWQARRLTVAAMGRLAPSYITQDGVVPRTKLPQIVRYTEQVSRRYGIPIANVMHAGDGNIHPILLFDPHDGDQVERVLQASGEILTACVRLGGSVTGEHGVGLEKAAFLSLMFSEADLRLMDTIRSLFDPKGLCNPGKIFPSQSAASVGAPGGA